MSQEKTPVARYEQDPFFKLVKELETLVKYKNEKEISSKDKLTYLRISHKTEIGNINKAIESKKKYIGKLEKEKSDPKNKNNKHLIEGLIKMANDELVTFENNKKSKNNAYKNSKNVLNEEKMTIENQIKEKRKDLKQLLDRTPVIYQDVKLESPEKIPTQRNSSQGRNTRVAQRRNSNQTPIIGGTSKRQNKNTNLRKTSKKYKL
jgi:hypothetical protein